VETICRREGTCPALYCLWSKGFLVAGKKRLIGDTMREDETNDIVAHGKKLLTKRRRMPQESYLIVHCFVTRPLVIQSHVWFFFFGLCNSMLTFSKAQLP